MQKNKTVATEDKKVIPVHPNTPYRRYSRKEINNQPGLTPADTSLLQLMHSLDKGGERACFATDLTLANELGWTESAVKNRISRLRAKGYIFTMGYERHGNARRRVVLKYGIHANVPGAYRDVMVNGRVVRQKRKANEPNPMVFLRTDTSGTPAHNDERQKGNDREITTTKSPSRLAGKGDFSFSFSQTSPAEVCQPDPVEKPSPAPVERFQPDPVRNPLPPGSKRKDPVAQMKADPVGKMIIEHFKIDCINYDLARKFMRLRSRNEGCNEQTTRYMLDNLEEIVFHRGDLPGPRKPINFVKYYLKYLEILVVERSNAMSERLDAKATALEERRPSREAMADRWADLQKEQKFKTFNDFYFFKEKGRNFHDLALHAARYFLAQGETSVCEDTELQASVGVQCIESPELAILWGDTVTKVTGVTMPEWMKLREQVIEELRQASSTLLHFRSFNRLLAVESTWPKYLIERAAFYIAERTHVGFDLGMEQAAA